MIRPRKKFWNALQSLLSVVQLAKGLGVGAPEEVAPKVRALKSKLVEAIKLILRAFTAKAETVFTLNPREGVAQIVVV